MVIARKDENYRGFGSIQFQQSLPRPFSDSSIETQRFRWIPSDEVARHGPSGLNVEFLEIRSGARRVIRPALGVATLMPNGKVKESPFFHQAHDVGLAIRVAQGLPEHDVRELDISKVSMDRLRSTQGLLQRQFKGPKDFSVPDNLVDELGVSSLVSIIGGDRCASTAAFMELGNAEARKNGIENLTREEAVQHALFALAKEKPLPLDSMTPEQTSTLVRGALLDIMKAPADVTDQELEVVADEFATVLKPHLYDNDNDYEEFLVGPKSPIVGQITERLRRRGSQLTRGRVTAALAELGWRGHEQWAESLEVLMRSVAAELSEPLTGGNLERFELLYYRHPWLDHKPLFLFAERFGFLRNGIEELLCGADLQCAGGVILRLLEFYGLLSFYRRDTDRKRKQLENQPPTAGGSAVEYFAVDESEDGGDFDDVYF